MIRFLRIACFLLITGVATSAHATLHQVAIDFEYFPGPDGLLGTADDVRAPDTYNTPLSNQYASLGLTFDVGALYQSYSGGNHLLYGTWPVARFSVPVHELYIDNYSYWNVFLTGYDASGNAIATDASVRESGNFKSRLSISSTAPIHQFSFVTDGDRNRIISFDNLVFTVAETDVEVPEPPMFWVFGIALAAFAFASARSRIR